MSRAPYTVEVVVPVYNEEQILEASIRTLRSYLDHRFPFRTLVTVADNASTDKTWEIATRLSSKLDGVQGVRLAEKGRGRALKAVWEDSAAEVVAYMDVDLSTGLDAMLPLVAPLLSGHSDVAIGSRLATGARVVRGPKREAISRMYNLIIRAGTGNHFTDAQCGFKALRTDAARQLLPLVKDNGWFFDTELLMLAEHNGLRIHEVPVDWVDDPDSRVDVVGTAVGDLKGLWRVSRQFAAGRGRTAVVGRRSAPPGDTAAARFLGVGGLSTLAYLGLFVGLSPSFGRLGANALALTACTVANVAAHHRYTFGAGQDAADVETNPLDRPAAAMVMTAGLSLGVGLLLTTAAIAATSLVSSSLLVALVAVTAANGLVSAGRFLAWRGMIFRRHLDALAARPEGVTLATGQAASEATGTWPTPVPDSRTGA
jgi:putative flippase GtrA